MRTTFRLINKWLQDKGYNTNINEFWGDASPCYISIYLEHNNYASILLDYDIITFCSFIHAHIVDPTDPNSLQQIHNYLEELQEFINQCPPSSNQLTNT